MTRRPRLRGDLFAHFAESSGPRERSKSIKDNATISQRSNILSVLHENTLEMDVSEIARVLNVDRTIILDLMAELEQGGFVESEYRLSGGHVVRLTALGLLAVTQ